ncbi:hypothetical protein B9C88_09520 [Brevibacillus laterosporus]|uniref:hypothetical protein n=1 Tax=Brevibacillus laterosporus TaxID=1465 RepID=UPI000BCC0C36|nr:hypothetical protein [Brevibacillus laterosporus]PCN44445.1 hypothetical protein B9C88_09520 [Brevibacillus laterosporus]
MKKFLRSVFSFVMVACLFSVQAGSVLAQEADSKAHVQFSKELLEEMSRLSEVNPVGPKKPRVEYHLSNGYKVVKTYSEKPIKQPRGITQYADSVSSKTMLEYTEQIWIGGLNVAQFRGGWNVILYRDESGVTIDSWDYFTVNLRGQGSYSKSEKPDIKRASGTMRSPAIARSYVTFTTNFYQSDVIWEVKISPDKSISTRLIESP